MSNDESLQKIYSSDLAVLGLETGSRFANYWYINGGMVSYYAKRVIPSATSYEDGIKIPINPHTTEDLIWLMSRFDLRVQDMRLWNQAKAEMVEFNKRIATQISTSPYSPPDARFLGELRDYQERGVDFLIKANGRALLADEMGLGKGVQALAALASLEDAFPALIVAPLTVLEHWNREVTRFLRNDDGTAPRVQKIRTSGDRLELQAADIYLINYELIARNVSVLSGLPLNSIILDEIQGIRHSGTLKFNAIHTVASETDPRYRIGLSGTPIHNYASEIYNIIDWIYPGYLGSWREFLVRFFDPLFGAGVKGLKEVLERNIMLRRRKREVADELPPKSRLYHTVGINGKLYEDKMAKEVGSIIKTVREFPGTDFQKREALLQLVRSLPDSEREVAALAKVDQFIQFINETFEDDEPLVIFCHHLAIHEALHDAFYLRHPASIVGGQTDRVRQENIDTFQNGETNLMIAGLRAGSLGINLTSAAHIVFAELDWSPAIHWQAEDRLHRIGQERPVFAYYVIGKDTLDEKIAQILAQKASQFETLFGDSLDGFMNVDADLTRALLERFLLPGDLKEFDRILSAKKEANDVVGH